MHLGYGTILQLALLTSSASAFYPLPHPEHDASSKGDGAGAQKRAPLYLWDHEKPTGDGSGAPTLNIRKRVRSPQHRGTPVKRDNKYVIQSATPPDYPSSLPVHNDGMDYSYFGAFKIGSSGKEMWLLIDTGAPHTWMFGSDCKSDSCKQHRTIGSSDSTSLKTTQTPFNVSYGTGSIKGSIASDSFQFAGFNIKLGFGLAASATDDFKQFPIDGILGLGRTSIKDPKSADEPTIMDILAAQKALKANIIGINIWRHTDGAHNGQMTLGDVNPALIDGDITYTKATGDDGLWGIPLDDASANGASLGFKNKRCIIDTGTSAILMPPADAKKLLDGFPGVSITDDSIKLPCDTKGSIKLTFSGATWEIPAVDILGEASGSLCSSNVVGRQTFGENDWLVGDTFLKNVYAVYDFDQSRIGLAKKGDGKAKASATSTGSSPSSTSSGQTGSSSSSLSSSSSSSSSTSSAPAAGSTSSSFSRVLLSPAPTGAKNQGSATIGEAAKATESPTITPAQQGGAISQGVSVVGALATVIVTVYVTVT